MLLASCQQDIYQTSFTVKNKLDLDRTSETVSVPVEKVEELAKKFGTENLLIRDTGTDKLLVTQALDNDADGNVDEILFQTNIKAKEEKKFKVEGLENGAAQKPKSELTTYSRFVPERTDDYTWENDRVAFRTYGPVAQQMVEDGTPGGTLTSGMDAWLKRVDYPIIDKWYKGYLSDPMFYHKDTGEGYDPYHVGASRGIGGIGVWADSTPYVSKNFTSYKKIAEGPIRTVFELTYAPWSAKGTTVKETKRISLDLGSNLTRYEVELQSDKPLPNITTGITLHDKKGEVNVNEDEGWFRYWEPMDDSSLGTGIVIAPASVQDSKVHKVQASDQSHLFVIGKAENNTLTYYAGFGWEKSGQFKSKQEWDNYLADFAKRIAFPLEVAF
ncbi:DUF4861 domain-containing protein [Pontibacter harenae]|uniref:DUF4861 domain-containing protein n=1 Tax=Pontibacter harenae TaxID=2894083 RepID=UPI001E3AE943|nr:DUF4861 domain-containing protein [Pontibacter harenae]MCC9167688.1 DUF4861 domain-containing protein [Pontibacter harenae]